MERVVAARADQAGRSLVMGWLYACRGREVVWTTC